MSKSKTTFTVAAESDFQGFGWQDRTGFASITSIPALQAYLGLKSLFGPPNTHMIDEDKEQWTYLLKTDSACLQINDWKLTSWSIHVYEKNGDKERSNSLIQQLQKTISHTGPSQRTELSKLTKSPHGHLIENPFAIYYHTAVELLEIAENVNASANKLDINESFRAFNKEHTLSRASFFQFFSALEGLLNLLYELYLKPSLREPRIIDRLMREQIDVKLRLAPIYCECFASGPIDHTSDAFRNFAKLVNARNDFIHANVTKNMKTPVVKCDGFTFLMSSPPRPEQVIPNSISDLGLDEAKRIKSVLDEILQELLAAMGPRFRRELTSVLYDEYVTVEYEQDIPILVVE